MEAHLSLSPERKPAGGCVRRLLSRRSVVPDGERNVYRYSHEVAVVIATYGASTARLTSADPLLCNAACGSVMVLDHFRCTAILCGRSLMKLHCIQSRSAQRLP